MCYLDWIQKYQAVLLFVVKAHEKQYRKFQLSVPYANHPITVAAVIANVFYEESDIEDMVCAALLHDVLEDCPQITESHIRDVAGEDVLRLVLELTNPTKNDGIPRAKRKELDREHLKNVSWAAKAIKLADRYCNLLDCMAAPLDFMKLYAEESEQLLDECLSDCHQGLETAVREQIQIIRQRYNTCQLQKA